MSDCLFCNNHVTDSYARVFADDQGRIFACPNCSANAGVDEVARERREAFERGELEL